MPRKLKVFVPYHQIRAHVTRKFNKRMEAEKKANRQLAEAAFKNGQIPGHGPDYDHAINNGKLCKLCINVAIKQHGDKFTEYVKIHAKAAAHYARIVLGVND